MFAASFPGHLSLSRQTHSDGLGKAELLPEHIDQEKLGRELAGARMVSQFAFLVPAIERIMVMLLNFKRRLKWN